MTEQRKPSAAVAPAPPGVKQDAGEATARATNEETPTQRRPEEETRERREEQGPREVRYERLRPAQIIAAREACAAIYIPLGNLEWHGRHNPVGLDALKAHALAVRCAEAGGGLVFPPVYFGECREEALIEAHPATRDEVAEAMRLPAENFAPGYMRRSPAEQVAACQQLLLHILNEAQSLGFRVMTFVAGHYPLLDHARAAAAIFHQQRWSTEDVTSQGIPWAFSGYELVKDRWPDAGDSAGFWETSLMLALEDPALVDTSVLPADPEEPLLGVGTVRPVQEANAAFGAEAVAEIVVRATGQVSQRLLHPAGFYGHGLRI